MDYNVYPPSSLYLLKNAIVIGCDTSLYNVYCPRYVRVFSKTDETRCNAFQSLLAKLPRNEALIIGIQVFKHFSSND